MKGFTVIKYVGDDAGEVLCTILNGGIDEEAESTHEIATKTQMGFVPNPESEEPDEPSDGKR